MDPASLLWGVLGLLILGYIVYQAFQLVKTYSVEEILEDAPNIPKGAMKHYRLTQGQDPMIVRRTLRSELGSNYLVLNDSGFKDMNNLRVTIKNNSQ